MLTLEAIRACFEGVVPAVIATQDAQGVPNVAPASQVHYVDSEHVALSFQFFNKTRANIEVNPRACVKVVDPDSGAQYRLRLEYQCTETSGPLFEYMKARLAGIASLTGMADVFHLRGADLYRVLSIEAVPVPRPLPATPRAHPLMSLRACAARLQSCNDLKALFDGLMAGLRDCFAVAHAMLLLLDESGQRLYTVASLGYAESGVGAEVAVGEGVIGVAARQCIPIRIGHMAHEYLYNRAVREGLEQDHVTGFGREIPLPGLEVSNSQLAVPVVLGRQLLGVIYLESPQTLRFSFEHEDAMAVLADQLALRITLLQQWADEAEPEAKPATDTPVAQGEPLRIEYYAYDNSVFMDGDYFIKGVAGAIFWKLVRDYSQGRSEFSNRQLRRDPEIPLPELSDNLEARLILLQKRLQERCPAVVIEKSGRGRFVLKVGRPLQLEQADDRRV